MRILRHCLWLQTLQQKNPVLVYVSISGIVGFTAFACMFVFFHQDELGHQLFARKDRVYCVYVILSLVSDFLGRLITCLLAHRERYNMYEYICNILPAGLSILNTLINACM